KALGLVALLILFRMAATSHDYWLVFLTPPVWRGLHMALYVAYGLVVMHMALGVMQYDRNPFIPAMLAGGFAIVTLLHLVVGWQSRQPASPRSEEHTSELQSLTNLVFRLLLEKKKQEPAHHTQSSHI